MRSLLDPLDLSPIAPDLPSVVVVSQSPASNGLLDGRLHHNNALRGSRVQGLEHVGDTSCELGCESLRSLRWTNREMNELGATPFDLITALPRTQPIPGLRVFQWKFGSVPNE
jgi:hypothetical protein